MSLTRANLFFSVLALAAAALALSVVAVAFAARRHPDGDAARLLEDLRGLALPGAFVVAATSTAGSLYYSEVQGFLPCEYCWYQRIAMYPLAVMLGVAWLRRDPGVRRYALPVAVIGLAVSVYHYQLERFPEQGSSCSALVPCTVAYFEQWGFVTLAFMAMAGFAAIIALLAIVRPDDAHPASAPLDHPDHEDVSA